MKRLWVPKCPYCGGFNVRTKPKTMDEWECSDCKRDFKNAQSIRSKDENTKVCLRRQARL